MRAIQVVLALAVIAGSACAPERSDPPRSSNRPPVPAEVAPAPAPTGAAEPAPETAADPLVAYAHAEADLRALVAARAEAAAGAVIAAHAVPVEAIGAELVWYPAVQQVAARRREVIYEPPQVAAVRRSADEGQPYQAEVIVRCRVRTRSGAGVEYVGVPPTPPERVVMNPVLPQATRADAVESLEGDLRAAALAAIANGEASEPAEEQVHVTLVFAIERATGAVALLTPEQAFAP